jgi:hypothetical protein
LAAGLVVGATLLPAAPKDDQRTFATPQEAVQATIDAAERNDTAALLQLFGPEGKDIVESGDPAQDKEIRAEFARSAHEKLQIDEDPFRPDRVAFTVGTQGWPFPVPVIREGGRWRLDSASGRIEIFARRIGRNELNVMEVCRGYAEAQIEYAAGARKMGCIGMASPTAWSRGLSPRPQSQVRLRWVSHQNRTMDTTSEC